MCVCVVVQEFGGEREMLNDKMTKVRRVFERKKGVCLLTFQVTNKFV